MPTIIATLGAADANSLVDVETADAYFDLGLGGGAWGELDQDTKERALVSATRDFSAILRWDGVKASSTQALPFPRRLNGMSDGLSLTSNVTAAVCEHALALAKGLTAPPSERQSMRAEGVLSWSMGNRSETLAAASGETLSDPADKLSAPVRALLTGWFRVAGTMDSGRRPAYGGNYDQFGQWWPSELMP